MMAVPCRFMRASTENNRAISRFSSAAVRTMHTPEDADQSGFTGAVLADDRMDFAERHSEVDAVQRHRRAEPFADALSTRGPIGHGINAARTAPACSGRSAGHAR